METELRLNVEREPVTTVFEVLKGRQMELLPLVVMQQIEAFAQATGWSVGLCAVLFPYFVAALLGFLLVAAAKIRRRTRATKEQKKRRVQKVV